MPVCGVCVLVLGPQFEALVRDKERNNRAFAFLFGGPGLDYYRWKLFTLHHNLSEGECDTQSRGRDRKTEEEEEEEEDEEEETEKDEEEEEEERVDGAALYLIFLLSSFRARVHSILSIFSPEWFTLPLPFFFLRICFASSNGLFSASRCTRGCLNPTCYSSACPRCSSAVASTMADSSDVNTRVLTVAY